MLAIVTISISTLLGLLNGPFWGAICCGLLLASIAVSERRELAGRATALKRNSAFYATALGSAALAQGISMGAFVAGRLLSPLLG